MLTVNVSVYSRNTWKRLMGSSHTATMQMEDHFITRVEKVYVCPRNIHVHRGSPLRCGAQCHKAQGNSENRYEEETIREVISREVEVQFVQGVCKSD